MEAYWMMVALKRKTKKYRAAVIKLVNKEALGEEDILFLKREGVEV